MVDDCQGLNGLCLQAGGATSSGPAAGTGLELILQGFNWESYRNNWYKVRSHEALSRMHCTVFQEPPIKLPSSHTCSANLACVAGACNSAVLC